MGNEVRNALQAFTAGIIFCLAVSLLMSQVGRLVRLKTAIPKEESVLESVIGLPPEPVQADYALIVAMIADKKRNYDVYVGDVRFPADDYVEGMLIPEMLPKAEYYMVSCNYGDKGHVKEVHFD